MSGIRRVVWFCVTLTVTWSAIASWASAEPGYVVLRRPAYPTRTLHGRRLPPPAPLPTRGVWAPTYAYGWFGAQPRRHHSVHHGYYRNYTQWTFR